MISWSSNTNKQGRHSLWKTVTSVGLDYKINWCVADMKRWCLIKWNTPQLSSNKKDLSDKLLGLAAVCTGVDDSRNVKEWCHFFLILFVGVDGAKMHSRQLLTSLKWSIQLPYHKRPWRPSCRTLGPYQQGSSTRRSDTCKNTWKDKMSTINNPSQNQANTSSTQHMSWEAPVFLTIFRQPTFFHVLSPPGELCPATSLWEKSPSRYYQKRGNGRNHRSLQHNPGSTKGNIVLRSIKI